MDYINCSQSTIARLSSYTNRIQHKQHIRSLNRFCSGISSFTDLWSRDLALAVIHSEDNVKIVLSSSASNRRETFSFDIDSPKLAQCLKFLAVHLVHLRILVLQSHTCFRQDQFWQLIADIFFKRSKFLLLRNLKLCVTTTVLSLDNKFLMELSTTLQPTKPIDYLFKAIEINSIESFCEILEQINSQNRIFKRLVLETSGLLDDDLIYEMDNQQFYLVMKGDSLEFRNFLVSTESHWWKAVVFCLKAMDRSEFEELELINAHIRRSTLLGRLSDSVHFDRLQRIDVTTRSFVLYSIIEITLLALFDNLPSFKAIDIQYICRNRFCPVQSTKLLPIIDKWFLTKHKSMNDCTITLLTLLLDDYPALENVLCEAYPDVPIMINFMHNRGIIEIQIIETEHMKMLTLCVRYRQDSHRGGDSAAGFESGNSGGDEWTLSL